MTLKLLVHWEDESEIESAISLMGELREYMRDRGLYSGASLVNIPFMKTVGIKLKDSRPPESAVSDDEPDFKERQTVIPVEDHLGASTLASTINHPKEGVWAEQVCRGNRWCVVIHAPIPSSSGSEKTK